MKALKLTIVSVVILLSGCSTVDANMKAGSQYIDVLNKNGRPDYIIHDYINRQRILIYSNTAFFFQSDSMRLLNVNEAFSIRLPRNQKKQNEDK